MTCEHTDFHACPCCELCTIKEVGAYEICPTCGWEDDPVQRENPDYVGGANHISLTTARAKWCAAKG